MPEIELVLGLLAVVVALGILARRLGLPYPIVMVVAGLALAVVPGIAEVELAPDVVFLVFLPPILYAGGDLPSLPHVQTNPPPLPPLPLGLRLLHAPALAVLAPSAI